MTIMTTLPNILIVDDEPVNLSTLVNVLEDDYDISVAKSGEDALELLNNGFLPEIILLDIQMPNMDGYEVIKKIKKSEHLCNIPVIFVTGRNTMEDEEEGLSLGAVDYITKPFYPSIVHARIKTQIENKQAKEILKNKTQLLEDDLHRAQKVGKIGTWKACLETANIVGSPEFYNLLGLKNNQELNLSFFKDLVYYEDRDFVRDQCPMIISGTLYEIEFRTQNSNGKKWLRAIIEYDNDIEPTSLIGTVQDITQEKNNFEKLKYLAYRDILTGLPNKYAFEQELKSKFEFSNKSVCIHMIDLDGLTTVNTSMGEDAGDEVIKCIAKRLSKFVENIGYVACLGGDIFILALYDENYFNCIEESVNEIRKIIKQPIQLNDEISITAGIGTVLNTKCLIKSASSLLRMAENALYQSKLKGNDKHTFVSLSQYQTDINLHDKLEQIRIALNQEQFELHYQPKINITNGEFYGAEALVRWNHPDGKLVGPNEFIPYMENHPLIIELGDWVIDTALKQRKQWEKQGVNTTVSVNVASIQFQHPDFINKLKKSIKNNQLKDTSLLELEVLESGPLLDIEKSLTKIDLLKDIGVKISLDDFGTGHSSLQVLKNLRPDIIKIDKSFVMNMTEDKQCQVIIHAIIDLGYRFDSIVLAEGLETHEDKNLLINLGCNYAQGYGISKPIPGHKIVPWVNEWKERLQEWLEQSQ
ncbi:MAG: EAL domain-containing protein [Candidatus Woesearchaeota archaeon]